VVPDFEDIYLKIRPAIGNSGFGFGIGITHVQEGNTSVGHFQYKGVLVDIVREGGGWVEDRYGKVGSTSVRTCDGSRLRGHFMWCSKAGIPFFWGFVVDLY